LKKLALLLVILCPILQAQTTQTHRVDLTWTASTTSGVTSYNIYRAVGNCATLATSAFAQVGTSTTATFSDTTVLQTPPAGGTSYCYAVTALNGQESVFSNLSQAVLLPFPAAPNAPTGLTAKPF
jgi:hypothetical protein